jgi:hypothetical protein
LLILSKRLGYLAGPHLPSRPLPSPHSWKRRAKIDNKGTNLLGCCCPSRSVSLLHSWFHRMGRHKVS